MEVAIDPQLNLTRRPNDSSNFIITVVLSLVLVLGGLAYIILQVPPTKPFMALVVVLMFYFLSMLMSIILYLVRSPRGLETKKQKFRRMMKFGVLVTFVIFVGFGVAQYFHLL